MSIISIPNTFSVGAVIVAAAHNQNFSVIYSDYNGNITDANISPSAAIEYSKLSLSNSIQSTDILSTTVFAIGNIPSITYSYVKCTNTQASGTGGGSTTSGSWQTSILNTKDTDTGSIATLTSNTITLPAGTYLVRASAPFFTSGSGTTAQIRLFNSSDSSIVIVGQNSSNAGSANVGATSILGGQFTIVGTKNLILQYQVSGSSTNGQGSPYSFGAEVYAMIEFTKVA